MTQGLSPAQRYEVNELKAILCNVGDTASFITQLVTTAISKILHLHWWLLGKHSLLPEHLIDIDCPLGKWLNS